MNLHFSNKEMQTYLEKLGYVCIQVKYDIGHIYEDEVTFDVAYKDIIPVTYNEILNCRIESVFNEELKIKLLSL